MDYIYRMSTKDDQAALLRLWQEHSGWGELPRRWWKYRFVEGPLGPAWIAVMQEAESGEIVGQLAFRPSRVCVKGHELSAARPYAAILARSARIRGAQPGGLLDVPTVAMRRCATEALKAEGVSLTYGLPNPNWLPLFRETHSGEEYATFPLWSLPLPLKRPMSLPDGYSAGPLHAWDERVDRLWAKASRLYDCMVLRDTRTLPSRLRYGGYKVIEVERGGELVGLAAGHRKGDRQWLICDVLTVDAGPVLEATLKAACNTAHTEVVEASPDEPLVKVGILATPLAAPVLQRLAFQRDDYDFLVSLHVLGSDVDKDDVAPQKWYFSAND